MVGLAHLGKMPSHRADDRPYLGVHARSIARSLNALRVSEIKLRHDRYSVSLTPWRRSVSATASLPVTCSGSVAPAASSISTTPG